MKNRNKKSLAIGLLCIGLVFMGIGYSLLSSTLNISGTSKASGSFDVYINSVTTLTDSENKTAGANDVTGYPTHTRDTATLQATFNAPGDYITYEINVVNGGSIDAVISVETYPQESTSGSFKLSCDAVNGKRLYASSERSFKCRMSFDEDHQLTSITGIQSANMTITVNAVQKSTSNIPAPVFNPTFVVDSNGIIIGYNGSDPVVEIPSSYVSSIPVGNPSFDLNICIDKLTNLGVQDANSVCTTYKTSYDNGTLSSEIVAYANTLGIITQEYEDGNTVTITGIGDAAFALKGITGVDFSKAVNLRTIGNAAFENNQISSLTIPSYITSIGNDAFNDNQLSSLDLTHATSLKAIGNDAFKNNQLSSLDLTHATSLKTIGNDAFKANQLSSLDLTHATSLETIGDNAFFENNITGTLVIPSSVTSIGDYSFQGGIDGKNTITSLDLTNATNLKTIGKSAFAFNQISGTLVIPSSVISIGASAFSSGSYESGTKNIISTLDLTNATSLETIGFYAFYNNQITGTLVIPSSITSMGTSAFSANKTIQTINIDMTESTWNSRGLPASGWYDGNVTPTYKSE